MTSDDINNTIEELTEITEDLPGQLSETMKSKEFSDSCEVIELRLNILYEKIRMLEELQEAVQEYVDKEISEKQNQYKDKLKIIADLSDQFRDSTFVAQLVPFEPNGETVKDRDGSVITRMEFTDKKIEAPGVHTNKAVIDSAVLYTSSVCYDNTISDLKKNLPGIISLVEQEAVNGAEAEIAIQFKNPIECNYLNIDVFNCDVSNVRLLTEDAEISDTSEDSYMAPLSVSGIKAVLKTKNGKTVSDYDNEEFFRNFPEDSTPMKDSSSETLKSMLRNENINQKRRTIRKKIIAE